MFDWSHGYNVSTGYTYGYYRELAPNWLDFVAAIKGLLPPARGPQRCMPRLAMAGGHWQPLA